MADSVTVLIIIGVIVTLGALVAARFAQQRDRDGSRPLFAAFFLGGLAIGTIVGWLFGGVAEGAGIGLLVGALTGAYYPGWLDKGVRPSPSAD